MKKFIAGILVFSFFFSIGILLARHKPLWCDELFGQQATVQGTSWPNIILAHHDGDDNLFPLHHALQKIFMQLFDYRLPFVWNGEWTVNHPHAQLALRILPDILMSFAMTAIVLFSYFRSGFAGGAVAALTCLSMPMVWVYWVEARTYPLWFMLTTFQSLLFLDTVFKRGTSAPVVPFVCVHIGLCLTSPFGFVQTIVCQWLLWCARIRQAKFHVAAGLVPLLLGAYYFVAQGKVKMSLVVPWQSILFANFSPEEMIFLGIYVIFLLLFFREESFRKYFSLGRVFLPFCLAFMGITLAALFYVVWKSVPHSPPVVPRHFIFLTPVAIIMTTAIFSDLWLAAARRLWWRVGLIIIFAAGLLGQFLSAFDAVSHAGVYF